MNYICTAISFFKLGLERLTDTSMKLDMKASDTVSIHKPNTKQYFLQKLARIYDGKTKFFPFQIEKPLVRLFYCCG